MTPLTLLHSERPNFGLSECNRVKGGKTENDRVAAPELYPFTLTDYSNKIKCSSERLLKPETTRRFFFLQTVFILVSKMLFLQLILGTCSLLIKSLEEQSILI